MIEEKTNPNPNKEQLLASKATAKLRKSGFAVNRPSRKINLKPNPFANSQILKLSHTNNSPQITELNRTSTIDPRDKSSLKAETDEKENLSTTNKDKPFKLSAQQKIINIFSQESSRLLDKLLRAIFIQRKELSEAKTTLEQFIRTFMTTNYGSSHQYSLSNRLTSKTEYSPLSRALDRLLSANRSIPELQMAFSLFAKVLSSTGSTILQMQVDTGQAAFIKNNILKTYGGWKRESLFESDINICSLFADIEEMVEINLKNCELLSFLHMLLPSSQLNLSIDEIK